VRAAFQAASNLFCEQPSQQAEHDVSTILNSSSEIPWWKEPSKEQWKAWIAAWLGWTLDAFDFTIFLLIMVPIAKEFDVPLTAVTVVFTITLWMRLVGATAAGWMADRMGRKTPLMISILICADVPASALLLFVVARDLARRDAQITSTGTKICLEANSYCRNPDWWKSRSEHEPNG
jgi:hypothetical protein